jgi:hypothetical protein
MKTKIRCLLLLVVTILSACANPKTPAEFRQTLQEHANLSATHIEKFEVARSLNETAQFVKRRANECLNVKLQMTERGDYGTVRKSSAIFEPSANISAKEAEIYLTETYSSGDRIIMFVADYYPVSKTKTKVEFYYIWGDDRARIAKAFKMWSQGENAGCPDLSR